MIQYKNTIQYKNSLFSPTAYLTPDGPLIELFANTAQQADASSTSSFFGGVTLLIIYILLPKITTHSIFISSINVY